MTKTARRLIVAIAAGVAVFAIFSVYGDVTELRARVASFGWWALAAACGLAALNYAVRFVRWQLYLRRVGASISAETSALVFLSGFALSITPGKLGELVKSYLLRETHGLPIARTAPVVLAERITDLLALLALGLAGVAAYGIATEMVIVGSAVLGLVLAALAWPALADVAIRALTAPRPLARFRPPLREFYRGLRDLLRPAPLCAATGLGIAAWLAECVGFALVCNAFPGASVPLGLAVLIYSATTVAGALSFLPGGLLVTEAAMTLFLVRASSGMDQPTAIAATLLTRLATLWFAVAIGLCAMAVLRRRAPGIPRILEAGPESRTAKTEPGA